MTDPRPEWVEAGVAALVATGCAESGSAFIGDSVYVDGAVTVVLAAVIDQIKAEALREVGDWLKLGKSERDLLAAQACYDRADKIEGGQR